MRVEYWNPEAGYKEFSHISHERLMKAAKIIRRATTRNLRKQIGKGKTKGINRPVYLTGKYAGQPWTAREAGTMLKSIRIVERKEQYGVEMKELSDNVRIYVGHYLAFYANIFEYYTPFMRPAIKESLPGVRRIMGIG
jgi:hypothetical protein